ncbi:hypothetical protein BH10PLA1_BH10PLA1_10010 [soil metagenome]
MAGDPFATTGTSAEHHEFHIEPVGVFRLTASSVSLGLIRSPSSQTSSVREFIDAQGVNRHTMLRLIY